MASKTTSAATRAPRADALRNREAILTAAVEVFTAEGALASLDGIALRAGVGNATLYRNFPTRFDLLSALLPESIAAVMRDTDDLLTDLAPAEAFREWLVRLTWQLRIWHDLPTCISTIPSGLDPLMERTGALIRAGVSAHVVRDDLTADEVFEIVTAVSWGVDRYGDDELTARRKVILSTAGFFTP